MARLVGFSDDIFRALRWTAKGAPMKSPFWEVSDEVHSNALRLGAYLKAKGFWLETIHPYTHPDGVPWFWVNRWKNCDTGQKMPLPMHRTKAGLFVGKRPDFPEGAPLYRLHKLRQYLSDLVYLVEGEKCADCLERLGFIATTWPNGSQAVAKADFRPLAGRRVVLWPDHDEPGRVSMREALRILHGLGALALVLDVVAMDIPPKGDCVGWLALWVARHGKGELHEVPDGFELARHDLGALPFAVERRVAA
jgi:hypothetical protein